MRLERAFAQRRQLLQQLLPHRHRERRRHADVMQHAGIVVQAEQQRADGVGAVLVPAEAGDDAVGAARVLDLQHRALARLIDRRFELRDDAVEAGAFELLQPALGLGPIACHRRQVQRRLRAAEQPLEPRAPLGLRQRHRRLAAGAEQVERDEARRRLLRELRDSRRGGMDALLQRVEVEPARRHDDDLAVEHAALRQRVVQRLLELGEVAVQRLAVAALQQRLLAGAKDDRPEAVPLRLEQEAGLGGQGVGDLREHRLDRRRGEAGEAMRVLTRQPRR